MCLQSLIFITKRVSNFIFNKYLTGVGYRPQPPASNVESTLITYKHSQKPEAGTWDTWVKRLNLFLERKFFKSLK